MESGDTGSVGLCVPEPNGAVHVTLGLSLLLPDYRRGLRLPQDLPRFSDSGSTHFMLWGRRGEGPAGMWKAHRPQLAQE